MTADIYNLNTNEARKTLESNGLLGEEYKNALIIMARNLADQGKNGKAHIIFMALTDLFPTDTYLKTWLSYTLLALGRLSESLKISESLNAYEADDSIRTAIFLLRSKALWQLGRIDEAQAQLHEHLKIGAII